MENEQFARNLRRFRQQAHLTQDALAEAIGYSKKAVSKWETGACLPPLSTAHELAVALHIPLDALFAPEKQYFLGIDGGGTKTEFLLCDAEKEICRVVRGASNPNDIGMEAAFAVLTDGIRAVCGTLPLGSVRCFAGLAGGTSGDNRARLLEFLSTFGFEKFDCNSDNENIIAAGLNGQDGVTLILGTGICAFTVQNGGRKRTAGWGYLLDSGGSAYNFGIDALHASYAALDGTGEPTLLTELIAHKTGLSANELLAEIYRGGKRYAAGFAPLVFAAAEAGDAVAMQIFARNTECIAQILEAAVSPFPPEQVVPIVVSGGLTAEPFLWRHLTAQIPARCHATLSLLPCAPVDGAVRLAQGDALGEKF